MRLRVAVSLLVLVPALAAAQRLPSASDLDKRGAVRVLLDKKKQLALADSQVAQLEALGQRLRAEHAPLHHRVDSLRKALGGSSADVAAQIAAADVMEEVRASQQADEAQALALLTEAQRPKAVEVLQAEREAQRRAGRGSDAMSRDQDLGRGYGRTRTRP